MTGQVHATGGLARARGRWAFPAVVGTWFVVYFAARFVLERPNLPASLRVAAAVVPVALFVAACVIAYRAIRRADELEQRIHLLAAAVAYPAAAAIILLLGLLDRAAILSRSSLTDVWPVLTSAYLIAYVFARARYHPTTSSDES